jgi:hypothetical protein
MQVQVALKRPEGHPGQSQVTIPLCPPSIKAEDSSIAALKRHAHEFVHQQMTRDDGQISYLESADAYEYDMLVIGRMIVQ